MIPLSVLDLSVTSTATPPSAALRNSIDLARHVDRLGYVRYWLAEHHSLPSVASPSPDIMIGQIAAATKHIRVGSGGVMLPNHAPLVVAERFKILEALFPGRIDLGLGRAPGTDGTTAYALRSRLDRREGDDFLERLHELMLWETREFPAGHPYNNVIAMPDDAPLPPIWLLGSSDYSSELSAQLGMGFGFAHHFANHDAIDAMTTYRAHFTASRWRAQPHAILAVAVVTAETDAEAEAKFADYRRYIDHEASLTLMSGWTGVDFSTYELDQQVRHVLNDAGRSAMDNVTRADPDRVWTVREVAEHIGIGGIGPVFVGGPAKVADAIEQWVEQTGVDGLNLAFALSPESFADVADMLVPELTRRGRYKKEYQPGTLREKMFGAGRARLAAPHPAASYRP